MFFLFESINKLKNNIIPHEPNNEVELKKTICSLLENYKLIAYYKSLGFVELENHGYYSVMISTVELFMALC